MNVLFVCKGNTGRSQWAEALFNALSREHKATSAGTHVAADGREGTSLTDTGQNVLLSAKEAGIDLSRAKRRQVTPEMVERADKVVVITAPSDCPDSVRRSGKTVFWDIPDAKGTDYPTHRRIRDQVGAKVRELVKELG